MRNHNKNLRVPSETNIPEFSETIADKILIELDGWQLITDENPSSNESNESNEMFIDPNNEEEMKNVSSNHKVSIQEVEHFFDTAFEEALAFTNRYDINDLNQLTTNMFVGGVIKLTASNLWIKYNTSVTVNNEEGIIDYGQGGKLYKKYLTIIEPFIKGVRMEISAI